MANPPNGTARRFGARTGFALGVATGVVVTLGAGPLRAWWLPTRGAVPPGCEVVDWGEPGAAHPHRVRQLASGIEFLYVPAGAFVMGDAEVRHNRGPEHYRLVRNGFYLGVHEVTVGQWRRFAAASEYRTDVESGVAEGGCVPTGPTIDDRAARKDATWQNPLPGQPGFQLLETHPVTQVTYADAKAFAQFYGLHLPSEAQWEYAYRAGATGYKPAGDWPTTKHMNFWDARAMNAYGLSLEGVLGDGHAFLAPCCSYPPSPWGFHDLAGNVEEYCADAYVEGERYRRVDEQPIEIGSRSGFGPQARVVRGGSWMLPAWYAQFSYRVAGWLPSADRGFRVLLAL
jgi:formylglycine-generating enzyme required for sulfatase activity